MYNKTIIEFGFRMISWIIKTSCLYYLPKPKAEADNTDLGFDNSWYHAQPHPIIVYYICLYENYSDVIYLVFKGWLVYQIFFKYQLSFVELYFCSSSSMFLGICTGISSSMANSVKFSAIFLLSEAECVPRASRRMRVEEQILPILGNSFDILSRSQQLDRAK